MLNRLAISVLADSRRVSPHTLRFFLRILRDYDLRHYVAIPTTPARELYSTGKYHSRNLLANLTRAGLLEMGPTVTRRIQGGLGYSREGKIRTYRLAPQFLLEGKELREWCRQNKEVLHRRKRYLPKS